MWMVNFKLSCILISAYGLASSSTNYSKDALVNQYPDYGTKWIFFPDGNGVPRVGYLEMPANQFAADIPHSDDIENLVTFRLYTRKLKDGNFISANTKDIFQSDFDVSRDTKFITHGWLSSGNSDTCIYIKDAYLFKEDVNVIIVDWGEIAGNIFYPIPMAHTKEIGSYYGKFINHLIANGAKSSRIHLIGHSLGAHVSGFAGRASIGKLSRITGLDPALPGFDRGFKVDHLLPSDADFVDVIHTCGGVLGVLHNLGHADFYPNGGAPPQPGCGGVAQIIEACSHGRSWKYFAESIMSEQMFMSQKCNTWEDYIRKSCAKDLTPMGNPAPPSARGSYYLSTESSPPYVKIRTLNDINDNKINK